MLELRAACPARLSSKARENSATGTKLYGRVSSAQYCCGGTRKPQIRAPWDANIFDNYLPGAGHVQKGL